MTVKLKSFSEKSKKKAQLSDSTDVNFTSGIAHKIPKLSEYITKRMQNAKASDNSTVYTPKTYVRIFRSNRPNVGCLDTKKIDIEERIFWFEFEQMVLNDMRMDDDRWKHHELYKWSFAYSKYTENQYQNLPLFMSRMLLVRLKLIAVFDQLVGKEYPLLLQHKSGINANLINGLLIPQHKDMCIAREIEKYFQRRNDGAKDPSLNGEQCLRSFSVKYAEMDAHMQKIRTQILKADERNVNEKKIEWQKGREKVKQYKNEANSRTCSYYSNCNGYMSHSGISERCKFTRIAQSVRIMQYEHLLPTDEMEQLAIVFELQIPIAIAHLRDVLNAFAEFCLGDWEHLKITGDWKDRSGLMPYKNDSDPHVTLGSTTVENLQTFHVDCSFETFIIENTNNCKFHAEDRKKTSSSCEENSIKDKCTFETQNEYAELQWTLESTNHSQNEVLAKQSQCRQELTLSEYKNFGSLRADGHRLQLRKLFGMIETESLSFEKESVLGLIMQTLWESGLNGDDDSIRESHVDFRDPKFCSAMIELLEKYVKQQRNNWMHPLKLLIVTLIAVRAFEINCNDAVALKIAKLLYQIRAIVLEWLNKIEYAIREMTKPDENTEQELRMKLIYVAIVGGVTFFICPKQKNYEMIFGTNTEDDLTASRARLHFNVSLKNSVRMYTNDETKLPSNVLMFLRLMEYIGANLEPKIRGMIGQNSNEMYKLIKMLWSRAACAEFQLRRLNEKMPHLLVTDVIIESKKQIVTIDIITGSFLVDGFPLSRLPDDILESDIYRWFFGSVVFEVQPDGASFSTVHRFNNCCYEFNSNKDIIISERNANQSEKELIDHHILEGELPHHLVENYSHWWNKKGKCIEFRRRAMDKTHFSKVIDIDYLLDLNKLHLSHVQTQRQILDIKSEIFEKIIDRMSRLEHPKHILIFLESTDVAKVELLRMNLKFQVNLKTNDWISNEFNGMRISRTQNVGTLYGLNHGLILESIADAKTKSILIPNGDIEIKRTDDHVSASIQTEGNLHSPTFYLYHGKNILYLF